MSHPEERDVEQPCGVAPGTILCFGAVFALLLLLLLSGVRLYEKKEEARHLTQELTQQQEELQKLRQELEQKEPLRSRAEALGMEEMDPEKVTILHIDPIEGK